MYRRIYVRMQLGIHVYIDIYIEIYTCIHVYMYIDTCICTSKECIWFHNSDGSHA